MPLPVTMTETLLQSTRDYVRHTLSGEGTGHDWWHIQRVTKTALYICDRENADPVIVELAALLHDIDDWKFSGDVTAGASAARAWLEQNNAPDATTDAVVQIIERLSYKGGFETRPMTSLEGKIVQDADRLDALGPVGIARTFAYGGAKHRLIHDPDHSPESHADFESFKAAEGTTINHFYEKLFKLKDTLHTATAKQIGEKLHRYIERYIADFYAQWDGRFDSL
ncbi:MAG: HD domain-containing protein [Chloroflexota bacterium]